MAEPDTPVHACCKDNSSDEELMEGVKARCTKCFTILFKRHWEPLVKYVNGIVHDWDAAEEIALLTFWKVWWKADTFEAGTHFRPWLNAIAYHTAMDWLKVRRRSPDDIAFRDEGASQFLEQLADEAAQPHEETLADQSPASEASFGLVRVDVFRDMFLDYAALQLFSLYSEMVPLGDIISRMGPLGERLSSLASRHCRTNATEWLQGIHAKAKHELGAKVTNHEDRVRKLRDRKQGLLVTLKSLSSIQGDADPDSSDRQRVARERKNIERELVEIEEAARKAERKVKSAYVERLLFPLDAATAAEVLGVEAEYAYQLKLRFRERLPDLLPSLPRIGDVLRGDW